MMRVVVFAPNGIAHATLAELESTAQVTVVRWQNDEPAPEATLGIARPARGKRVVDTLSRTLPGRMLVRILPLDTGARFWSASRGSAVLAERVGHADLLVAAERDAGFAVWNWMRRRRRASPVAAVRGIPATRAWLARSRSS